ncbi:MAG: homing endonuclease [Parcubacteria group bacterium Gr01-1014_66]|nr:MAG: homing endonuclease [Parcubacteria group bacterium Gr01-1014_66]
MDNTVGSLGRALTSQQKALIIGTLLGDGSFEFVTSGKNVRLQILHSGKQEEYVRWKYRILQSLVRTEPKLTSIFDERYGRSYTRMRFRTLCHNEFVQLRKIFYRGSRKIVPKEIDTLLIDPLSLAVWYMDDGKWRPDCRGIYLDTICFSIGEQKLLISCLQNNFGVGECKLHWNGEGYHIYIPYPASMRFRAIILPHVIPSMIYKLPPITPERLSRRKFRQDRVESQSYNTPVSRQQSVSIKEVGMKI